MNIEHEFRFALTAAQYDRVRTALGLPLRVVRQRNVYFDTASRALCSKRFGLRLREEEGRFRLTLKGPERGTAREQGEGLNRRAETETDVSEARAAELLRAGSELGDLGLRLPSELQPLCAERVAPFGSIETERAIHRVVLAGAPEDFQGFVELDRVTFPGGRVDHELEVEWGGAGSAVLGKVLAEHLRGIGITPRPQEPKLSRFFRYEIAPPRNAPRCRNP